MSEQEQHNRSAGAAMTDHSNPTPADEFRTAHGAILATRSCEHHCADCEGEDHHWMLECPEDGDPLMVCKHCDAWREIRDEDDEHFQ